MPEKGKKIMLLDGTGLVYRAYYAFISRPLTTTRGENTSALFGFLKILLQIIRDFQPDSVITAFDISRKTFRQRIYAQYKAQREETPPDLKAQIPLIIEMLQLMKIPVLEMEDYEADNIIGALSVKLKKENDVYIVSGDKDLLQLVGGRVLALRPQHGLNEVNLLDSEAVKKDFGVYPGQIPDYLAIVGDASDNIPGVKGIGEKGASGLLSTYSTLEDIYGHIEDIKGAMKQKLIDNRDNAFLSKKLAVIETGIPVEDDVLKYRLDIQSFLAPEVIKKLEHYQITSIVQDIKKLMPSGPAENIKDGLFTEEEAKLASAKELDGDYKLITKEKELKTLIEKIKKKKFMSLDTETTSANPNNASLIGISVSLEEGSGFFIPVLYAAGQEFDKEFTIRHFKEILEDGSIKKTGQNIKYEIEVFRQEGIIIQGAAFDTMIAAYLINPTRTHNNLESLVLEYLGLKKKEYKEMLKNVDKKDKTLLDIPIEELVKYACGDSDSTLRLKNILEPLIEKFNLGGVFYEIEVPLIAVLAEMEIAGVRIDTEKLKKLSKELEVSMKKLEERIYHLAGHDFNINSPSQLGKVLFEELGLGAVKKTEGGKASTDEEVLSVLAYIHPLPAEILKYRTYSKLKNTYIDALPALILEKTGRIHTSFNQTITATGRLSSSDPNLQNIPVRDELGREIRKAFIADKGNVLISADYSQIELRVLAHFCRDKNMLKAFNQNLDIHAHTAALVFGVNEKDVTPEMRQRAKGVNFGIIYGLQSYGLSKQIGISIGEAREFIQNYFKSFPKVKAFVDEILLEAQNTGEMRTLSGRYRKFPDLKGKEIKPDYLSASQRMALNTKMQGSAADIIKIAMIELQKYITENKPAARLLLQIHDELVLEVKEKEADEMKEALKHIMENAYKLDVPLVVDVGTGKNWGEAH